MRQYRFREDAILTVEECVCVDNVKKKLAWRRKTRGGGGPNGGEAVMICVVQKSGM